MRLLFLIRLAVHGLFPQGLFAREIQAAIHGIARLQWLDTRQSKAELQSWVCWKVVESEECIDDGVLVAS